MPIYTGKSADGSDIQEVQGMYLHPDGTFSNISPDRVKEERLWNAIYDHISGKRTLREEYNLIKEKKSTLPAAHRAYVVKLIEETKNTE